MADPVLQLRGFDKRFGALHVTKAVSLDVLPHEIHALIGPNGAGKSTLIAQIAGSLRPDSGEIFFAGENVTRLDPPGRARRGLARVFQISSIISPFTVIANVILSALSTEPGLWRHWTPALNDPRLRERALFALDQVDLAARAETIAGTLSYGERRALELAMGLVQNPRLILLDEPMAGVGHEESRRLTALLQTLKGHLPMLLIEHDMSAVFALADRVSVLVGGEIIVTGTPDEIRANPLVKQAYLGDEESAP